MGLQLRFGLAAAVAAMALALATAPRAGAASCSGASCTGLDPYASGCGSDQTVAGSGAIVDSDGTSIGRLTLYFSAGCQTNWGSASFNDGNPEDTPPVTIDVEGSQGVGHYNDGPIGYTYSGAGSPVWGNMVYSPGCAYATVSRGSAHGLAVQPGCASPSQGTSTGASCHGSSCTGQDPDATGCASGAEVAGQAPLRDASGAQVGSVTLYWSPGCQTNWGQASFDDGNPADTPPVTVSVDGTTGSADYDTPAVDYTTTGSGSPVWGNMVYSPSCAYAYVKRGSDAGEAVQDGCPAPAGGIKSTPFQLMATPNLPAQVSPGAHQLDDVATFTDSDPNETPSDFTATIDWGDGSSSSGAIRGTPQLFIVRGTHVWGSATGAYTVTATIVDNTGQAGTASAQQTVVSVPATGSLPTITGPMSSSDKPVAVGFGVLGTIFAGIGCGAGIFGEVPSLGADSPFTTIACAGGVPAGIAGTGVAIHDPPDPRFHHVFSATIPRLPRLSKRCAMLARSVCDAVHAAFIRYAQDYLKAIALIEDVAVSSDRFSGARRAHDRRDEQRQRRAESRYFAQWRAAVHARELAGRALGQLLERYGLDRRLSVQEIAAGRLRLLESLKHVSRAEARALRRAGLPSSPAKLTTFAEQQLALAPPPTDTSLSSLFGL